MSRIPDNIFSPRRGPGSAAVALGAALCLGACSAAPGKIVCNEIQMRVDYGDLTADQLRFAMQELEECRGRAKAAEARDSALIDRTEQRFTPEDEP
jgi:hypothetical protein